MKKHRNHRPTRAAGAPDTLQRAAVETLGLAAAQAAPTNLPAAANLAAPAIPAAQNAPAGRSTLATLSPATAAQADAPATPSPAASNAAPDAAPQSPAAPASNVTPDTASPAAQALLQRLMSQAERLRQQEPGFDLGRALRNPRFARLVAAGLDAGEAYDALRQPQLLDEAYRPRPRPGRAAGCGGLQPQPPGGKRRGPGRRRHRPGPGGPVPPAAPGDPPHGPQRQNRHVLSRRAAFPALPPASSHSAPAQRPAPRAHRITPGRAPASANQKGARI